MTLTIEQLLALAAAAGFSGPDLATAVSIALAESGGNPQAYNPERAAGAAQGHGSFGLWQIYITAHPEFSAAQLIDPAYNAQAAYAVYREAGDSFHPWSTFKNGAYSAHLNAVNQVLAAQSQDQTASTDSGDGSPGGFSPDGGETLLMFAVGAGLLWLLLQRI